MTKGDLRRARKAAHKTGQPLTGLLAIPAYSDHAVGASIGASIKVCTKRQRNASRAEQYARYIDCGPSAWDDR